MIQHERIEALFEALDDIKGAPKDEGRVELIVIRPVTNARRVLDECHVSLAGGMEGDSWAKGCWKTLEDGSPHPDVQVALMNARCIRAIAGDPEFWPPAGDNLFVDLDLSEANLPVGTQLAIGDAVLQVTEVAHTACAKFSGRYGEDAFRFARDPECAGLKLRGIYARVVKDGLVKTGDLIRKCQPDLGLG